MTRDELLQNLESVTRVVEQLPTWRRNLVTEVSKSASDTPRPKVSSASITGSASSANQSDKRS